MAHEMESDTEALQAQIDLSMAFAHNLVSSWMQSKAGPPKQNLDAELKEYMRKPPRLGVGASISDTGASSARETARLKSRLIGKKRPRAEDEQTISAVQEDDDSDSKAHAIKKKPKLDPFAGAHNKKKGPLPWAPQAVTHNANGQLENGTTDLSKRRKKKKKRKPAEAAPAEAQSARRQLDAGIPVLNLNGPVAIQPTQVGKKKKKRRHKKRASASDM